MNKNKLTIYFHGTNAKNAKKIMKEGFKKETWYADHLEDALYHGGNHIFWVAVKWIGRRTYTWQILASNAISKNRIVRYEIYKKPKVILENKKLFDKVFDFNTTCPDCKE